MTWQERVILDAWYQGPDSEDMLSIQYEEVESGTTKRVIQFDRPDATGATYQDLGIGARHFPLKVYIAGPSYDRDARTFEGMLAQKGVGTLIIPVHGSLSVIPAGEIKRRDNFVSGAGQAVFEVDFREVSEPVILEETVAALRGQVIATVDAARQAAPEEYRRQMTTPDPPRVDEIRENSLLASDTERTMGIMATVGSYLDAVRQQMAAINAAINAAIDAGISDPLTMAHQFFELVQTPGRIIDGVQVRLAAYAAVIEDFMSGRNGFTSVRDAQHADMTVTAALSGAALTVANGDIQTKTEALAYLDTFQTWGEDIPAWQEDLAEELGFTSGIDTHLARRAVLDAVGAYLLRLALDTKVEMVLVLDRSSNVILLANQLYGAGEERYDEIIVKNRLVGDEVLSIPAGREIRYTL